MGQYKAPMKGRPFIAYEKKPRLAAGPDGQTVKARPSVFVREHVDVKVTSFKKKTVKTDDKPFITGRVTFDAESVGLKHDMHGSVQADSKAAELLDEAFKNDLPVTVAIETSRRYAPQGGGEPISPLTPINELRGIVGESTKANAEVTNRNCRNLVVCVNGEFTNELVSDPEEWDLLREYRDGGLAPDGWAIFSGAVIPVDGSSSGSVDVRQQIREELTKFFDSTPNAPTRAGRPPLRTAHAAEAKPWEDYNTDGRFNHGSYLATALRETYAQAHQMLTAVDVNPAADQEATRTLVELLMAMADRIQLGVYRNTNGTPIRSDRSHHEAREWISFVSANRPELTYTADMADPTSIDAVRARNTWARQVITTVGPLMDTLANVAGHTPRANGPVGVPVIRPVAESTLATRYETLLGHKDVGLAKRPDRVFPLLNDHFGTHDLNCIETVYFAPVLAEWEADPAAFLDAARSSAAARQTAEPAADAA